MSKAETGFVYILHFNDQGQKETHHVGFIKSHSSLYPDAEKNASWRKYTVANIYHNETEKYATKLRKANEGASACNICRELDRQKGSLALDILDKVRGSATNSNKTIVKFIRNIIHKYKPKPHKQ